jgi:hypothetical protein
MVLKLGMQVIQPADSDATATLFNTGFLRLRHDS